MRSHQTNVRVRPTPTTLPFRDDTPRRTNVDRREPPAVKRTWISAATDTNRATLLLPDNGTRIAVVRVWVQVITAEGAERPLEIYFGTGATASTTRAKIIDILPTIKAIGKYETRTYDALSLGRAPTGLKEESVSYRWQVVPTNSIAIFVEYVVLPTNRRPDTAR